MTNSSIHTISEFLLHAGTNFRIFDLGRGVVPISSQTFLDMENGLQPAPRPRQQHAWFAILFWNGQTSVQHYIWFLKLPLDEQGKIISASRNHFLQIIVDALGNSIAQDSQQTQNLPDNPYSFVPNQSLMAQFSAMARNTLGHAPCEGYDAVRNYIQAPQLQDWNTLSVQAIADFAARLSDADAQLLIGSLPLCSEEFVIALFNALEPVELPDGLRKVLSDKLMARDPAANSGIMELAILRALSSLKPSTDLSGLLKNYLNSKQTLDIDSLSILAARHYLQLDDQLLKQFFELVAESDKSGAYNGALFTGLFSDLVQIPLLRPKLLALLRSPDRTPSLSAAIGHLFAQTQAGNRE